ncbi:hypothetical protein ACS0TY_014390 [Phlomoides rotata]
MFSLHQSDELVFGTPTTSKACEIPQDLVMDDTNFINFSSERRVSRTTNSELTRPSDERESSGRKVLHRDMERKRRKEMSDLHLTLRSLLPAQLQKGKRAVCDEMQEAATYIKNMHNNIEELRIRRDKLRNLSENKEVISSNDVSINQLPDGMMEILISTSVEGSVYLGLSRALEELAEREVDVVNCVSTRTNATFLHKIQIQARDMKSLDVSVLQDKLRNAMK